MSAKPATLNAEKSPRTLANLPAHIPEKPKYAVIDAHNHLFGDMPAKELISIMDDVGIEIFNNVTGNVRLPFDDLG